MKKKKLVKKYNELVTRYNARAEEIAVILEQQSSMRFELERAKSEKEEVTSAFLSIKEEYNKVKHERDVYRNNYGELVSIAVSANDASVGAISIKSIDFSDDVTTITWSDGETTSVKRHKDDKHDDHTAVAYAIAKRVLKNTSIGHIVDFYKEDHSKDAKYLKIYRNLGSKNPIVRVKAQKAWDKIPKGKRQSIKGIAKSTK